jgi:hypothetical protein
LSLLQDKIFFDISTLEDEPTVFSVNTGDILPNRATSYSRSTESFMDSFKVLVE